MDKVEILTRKFPGAEWVLRGDELTWLSDSKKPTKAKLEELWPVVQAEIAAEAQAKLDRKASVVAKLEALGLTVEEVSVAFGLEA